MNDKGYVESWDINISDNQVFGELKCGRRRTFRQFMARLFYELSVIASMVFFFAVLVSLCAIITYVILNAAMIAIK